MNYERFYQYIQDLYGTGLEVVNWNLNGCPQPLDSFIDDAIDYALEEEECDN